jgi:Mg/Co/Ni transporter MgtE
MGVREMSTQIATRTHRWQRTIRALQAGAVLQVVCLLLPLLDLWLFGSIDGHVRDAYPGWGPDDVALDRNAIAIGLVAVAALGLAGWLAALRTAKRGRGVRATVTTLFALGMVTLLSVAGAGGEPYDQYVPLWLGTTTLLVLAVPGVAAVMAAFREAGDHR